MVDEWKFGNWKWAENYLLNLVLFGIFDIINYMEFDGMYRNDKDYKMWQYGYFIDVLGVINDIPI